jgi:hypothetical protein
MKRKQTSSKSNMINKKRKLLIVFLSQNNIVMKLIIYLWINRITFNSILCLEAENALRIIEWNERNVSHVKRVI